MKKLLFILFLLLNFSCFGFHDDVWEDTSPYGSTFYGNDGDISYWLPKNKLSLSHLKEWYFYKGYSIGIYNGDSFFISDEINGKIYQFKEESKWQKYINQHNLDPLFTRWYNNDWTLFREGFPEEFFFNLSVGLITILLVPIVYWLIILPFNRQIHDTFKKIAHWIFFLLKWAVIILVPILTINWLFGIYPQSI